MAYFPFFTAIENRKCVIVGGGKVALAKAEKLLGFGPMITVVAPKICDELKGLPQIKLICDRFAESYIEEADFVIAATDDNKVNGRIFDYCSEHKIPVNTVDDPEKCSFIFPSIISRGDLTIAICSDGKSPFVTKYLRRQAEELIPDYMEIVLFRMGELRDKVKPLSLPMEVKNKIYECALSKLLASKGTLSDQELEKIVREFLK